MSLLRSNQLEALLIENEVKQIFVNGFKELFSSDLLEIDLFFDFLYFRERISKNLPLVGQELQNIEFCTSTYSPLTQREKLLYLLVMVFGKYAFQKASSHAEKRNMQKLAQCMKALNFAYSAASLLYFLGFLAKRRMISSFPLFLIGLKIKQIKPNQSRELDFELVNRVVIWEVLNKLLQSFLTSSSYLLNNAKKLFFISSFLGSLEQAHQGPQCYVCNAGVKTNETKLLPCEHSFCYACSKSRGETCPICNSKIEQRRLIAD